jgi:Interferon-induced transmembrane protein/GYF domain 2
MSQFYYTDGKERFGPFSLEQLREKNITGETLVWKEGLPDWVPARNLSDLETLFSAGDSFPPPLSVPYANPVIEVPPKNWLIESILVTILCCLPLGIVGIIHATKVDTLWSSGQKEAALKASREAGKWVKIGAISGFVVIVLYVMLIVFGVVAGIGAGLEV